jgi:predicted nucleic acid-binding Zn ribbon protein
MANEIGNDPDTHPMGDLAVEGRRSASEGHCEQCGDPLDGKQERFCSDACRMRHRRDEERRRRLGLLDTIETAIKKLRDEVLR